MIKAIIITQPRSGTQMIYNALRQRADIDTYFWPQTDKPMEELDKRYSRQDGNSILFVHHHWGPRWSRNYCKMPLKSLWRLMSEIHDHAIFLQRKDVVARYLSVKIGYQIGFQTDKPRIKSPKVRFDVKDFARWLEDDNRLTKFIGSQFPAAFRCYYRQLVTAWEPMIFCIQKHLGLNPVDLPLLTYKWETRPVSEIVENFAEVKEIIETLNGRSI